MSNLWIKAIHDATIRQEKQRFQESTLSDLPNSSEYMSIAKGVLSLWLELWETEQGSVYDVTTFCKSRASHESFAITFFGSGNKRLTAFRTCTTGNTTFTTAMMSSLRSRDYERVTAPTTMQSSTTASPPSNERKRLKVRSRSIRSSTT